MDCSRTSPRVGRYSTGAATGWYAQGGRSLRRAGLQYVGEYSIAVSIFLFAVWLGAIPAQAEPAVRSQTVQVLLTSDVHFEAFWDPVKVRRLAEAPVEKWASIFASPDSGDRQQRFAALEQTCHVRGEDTSYPLLRSSLTAMRSHASRPSYIVLSGDLVAHAFRCKFDATFPGARPAQYRAFVEKTIEFVLLQVRITFPGTPVFASLGNNDTDCGDYEINAGSPFLLALAPAFTKDVHGPLHEAALKSFAAEGDYSAALPPPFHKTRLLVLDNLFEAVKYQSCSGNPDLQAGRSQVAWLQGQLEAARRNRQHVWVVAHIPPGIDPYATVRKAVNVCAGQPPVDFLSSNALGQTLADFSDVVRLAIFAHTHMDEIRLLRSRQAGSGGSAVAAKLVPSISPVNGNHPSFLVARVAPGSATLDDYKVIVASNKTGIGTQWTEEYDFGQEYHQAKFDSPSVAALVQSFSADPSATQRASQSYAQNFFVGRNIPELKPFWPQYVCALSNMSASAYRSCVCAAAK